MNSPIESVEPVVAPFIDGQHSDSSNDALFEVMDPSTGRHRLSIPAGGTADVDRAVSSARHAFDDGRWSEAPPSVSKENTASLCSG